MKLPENPFKAALRAGQKQIGVWNSLCSAVAADALAGSGYDWALLDMEHAPNDPATVLSQLQAYSASPTVTIVRPAWNDPVLIKQILDLGARGILLPMVQTRQEAAAAVAATRYPPEGTRGVSLSQRGNRYGRVSDYHARIGEELCVLVQIETVSALEQTAEIAAVEGVDGVFFGPADLGADMGLLGQIGHDDLWAAIAGGVAAAASVGVPSGTLVGDAAAAGKRFREGFSFVACSSDLNLLVRAADAQLANIRKELGGE